MVFFNISLDRSIVAPVPSLQTNIDDIPLDVAKPDSCQFVWHYLHSIFLYMVITFLQYLLYTC